MVNRQSERSGSCRLYGSVVGGMGFALALISFSALLPARAMAGDLGADIVVAAESTLVDPAVAKVFSDDNHAQDGTGLALFPKVRIVPDGPGLDRETRCSWWLPPELPLGGGFTFALFCNGPGGLPDLGES